MRAIGLHLRLVDNPFDVLHKARALKLPIFQTFLTQNSTKKLATFSSQEMEQFAQLARENFTNLYLHVSYHANACEPMGVHVLRKELALAKKLGFTHAVLHPGSGKWCGDKEQAIGVLVSALNTVIREVEGITLVLENSAHGALSVGGDLYDFARVLDGLEHSHAVQFCIDTAHAYAYGYNLADDKEQDVFVQMLDRAVSITRVGLIHLNDTTKGLGKNLDQHEVMGRGNIGRAALLRFAQQPSLRHIPIILELPVLTDEEEKQIYFSCLGDLS
jgi:deoxyribonuclease-4